MRDSVLTGWSMTPGGGTSLPSPRRKVCSGRLPMASEIRLVHLHAAGTPRVLASLTLVPANVGRPPHGGITLSLRTSGAAGAVVLSRFASTQLPLSRETPTAVTARPP